MVDFVAGAVVMGIFLAFIIWPIAYFKGRKDMRTELKRRGEI